MDQSDFSEKEVERFFSQYYIDRGMVKWQGYYLSDHTSALNVESGLKKQRLTKKIFPQMTEEKINALIEQAVIKGENVRIQTNVLDQDGEFDQELVGKILGYSDDELYIGDGFVKLELIRNISIIKDNLN